MLNFALTETQTLRVNRPLWIYRIRFMLNLTRKREYNIICETILTGSANNSITDDAANVMTPK